MKCALVKTSSLGDVIHTFPALTDALRADPEFSVTWIVEESFAEVASWHPAVKNVIPIAWRRWRKKPWRRDYWKQARDFLKRCREEKFDIVIDAQGLLKSAVITRSLAEKRFGFSRECVRESMAAMFYTHPVFVSNELHMVERIRHLFANACGYSIPISSIDFGLSHWRKLSPEPYIVVLHGTTWDTKHYPDEAWKNFIKKLKPMNLTVKIPWANDIERQRAEYLAKDIAYASVLPKMKLTELTQVIAGARAVVAVDTGLGHISAACGVPTLSLFAPTDPKRVGTIGLKIKHLKAEYACAPCLKRECPIQKDGRPPCYDSLSPNSVLNALTVMLESSH